MIKYLRHVIATHILSQEAAMDVRPVLEKLRGVRIFKVCERVQSRKVDVIAATLTMSPC